MKNFKKISFLALTFGWIGLIVTHIIWSNLRYDDASGGDTGVILFWASLFLLIFYGLFILIPQKTIVKLTKKLNVILFSIISGVYALAGFIILRSSLNLSILSQCGFSPVIANFGVNPKFFL